MPTSAPAAPPSAETQKSTRDYDAYQEIKLDLADPVAVAEQLAKLAGDGTSSVEVLFKIGSVHAGTPRKALDELADKRDLDGDYQLIASASVNGFKNVKTATKRAVSIG